MLPRAVIAGSILVGLFGVGAYLKSGTAADDNVRASMRSRPLIERPVTATPHAVETSPRVVPSPAPTREVQSIPAPQASARPVVVSEPQFYCGAETKKGTPCSRRVKGNVRCYQHVGMPAMAGADKLTATK